MQILALKIAEFFMYIAQYGISNDIYHENLCLVFDIPSPLYINGLRSFVDVVKIMIGDIHDYEKQVLSS